MMTWQAPKDHLREHYDVADEQPVRRVSGLIARPLHNSRTPVAPRR
jgi:hypothetical protein